MKKLLAAFAAALAAMGKITWVASMEAGRLVWRAVRAVMAPRSPVDEAEAEMEAEVERAIARLPKAATFENLEPCEKWGLAAADHLHPTEHTEVAPGTLDRAAQAYLDSLSLQERATLLSFEARHVGQHLLGERRLPGLPVPPTAAEFAAGEGQRLAQRAQAARASLDAVEEQRAWVGAILDDLLVDDPPRGLWAA